MLFYKRDISLFMKIINKMYYKTLKKKFDIIKFENYLNDNDFIIIFDIDSNNIDTFKNLLKKNNIKFLSLNSLQKNSVKKYKELYNIFSGNTILISLDNVEIKQRTFETNNLIDKSKLYTYVKGVIFEKKIFRSNMLITFLSLDSSISTNFTKYLFSSLRKINYNLVNIKKFH